MFNMEVFMNLLSNKKFIKYVLFSFLTTFINVVLYLITCSFLTKNIIICNAVAYGASISLSFKLNFKYVYKCQTKQYKKQVLLYLFSKILSYFLDSLVLIILDKYCSILPFFEKIISNASTCVLNYIIGDKIIFKNKEIN